MVCQGWIFFRFLQVRPYLHADWEQICQLPSDLKYFHADYAEGIIDDLTGNKIGRKQKWEFDMHISIRDEMWEKTALDLHKLTGTPAGTLNGVFKTPLVCVKYCITSELCWRECGKIGDPHFLGTSQTVSILKRHSGGDQANHADRLSSGASILYIWEDIDTKKIRHI